MDSKKLEFANDVVSEVDGLCKLIFNVTPDHIANTLGLSHDQMEEVIKQIILGLPEKLFDMTSSKLTKEIKHLCAQEFIFFQVQESREDPSNLENLKRFASLLSRDILNRIENFSRQTSIRDTKNG
jgi:hypothetical protein